MNTKLHAVADANGRPLSFFMTAGQVTPADAARMRGVAIRLAQAIGGAARRNGVDVVRATLVGESHDACAPQPFVAGFHPAANPGWAPPVPYHPNQAGMNAIATALDKLLDR